MGDGALLLCRQLAEGPALLRHQEHRVVAKSRRPHGGKGDGTVAPALRRQLVPAGKGAGDGAGEVGRPGSLSPHVLQQQGIPPPVVQLLPAVTGGIHAGSSVQGVHTETGVVRDGGQPAGRADGLGLQHGVFRKGGAGLLHVYGDSHVCGAHHFHPQSGEDIRHLLQLTGVMGCQHEFHTVSSFSAARSRRLFRMVSTRSMVTMVISRM